MNELPAAVDAGQLLAFALDVTAVPRDSGSGADYRRLVNRYRSDSAFRSTFDGITEGTGCVVAAANDVVGIVLRTRPDGPFAWPTRVSDLPWGATVAKGNDQHARSARGARALVVIALLAYVAPSAADFDDLLNDDVVIPTVSVRELEGFVRASCEHLERERSTPTGDDETRPLWWHWNQLPPDKATSARIARNTTTYVVHDVLDFLAKEGLMIDVGPSKKSADKAYRPRRRLLYHYQDLLVDDLFRALRAQREEHGTPADDTAFREG